MKGSAVVCFCALGFKKRARLKAAEEFDRGGGPALDGIPKEHQNEIRDKQGYQQGLVQARDMQGSGFPVSLFKDHGFYDPHIVKSSDRCILRSNDGKPDKSLFEIG